VSHCSLHCAMRAYGRGDLEERRLRAHFRQPFLRP
jgi:hypothetical protein